MRKFESISLRRSNAGHNNSLKKINLTMLSKNGFYKKGEWEDLEKRRIYHIAVYEKQERCNRVLSKTEKNELWNSIKINSY